jgi:acyl-CoA hydrolase
MAEAQQWREQFKAKVVTAEEAVKKIPAGHRILIGSGAAEPVSLVKAMVEKGRHLADNEVVHLLTLGPAPYVERKEQHRFRHTAFFIGSNVRDAVAEGRADFMPVFLSEIPELIRSRRVRIDVALIQVSPPNHHGYVSLGVSVDIVRSAVEAADLVIAEVNPHMPWTHGDSFVDARRIDWLVPVDTPLLERLPESPNAVLNEIGQHIARLVPHGATLQLGFGWVADAVFPHLGNHVDLGVHTEMLTDGVMALADAGVISGRRKSLLPGKHVSSFIMGTRKLYEWVDGHPAVEMRPTEFINDPFTIARNDRMVAINGALAVDLTDQVASDTVGGYFHSGIGGTVDFMRGAARSRGGRPIMALPSTSPNGLVSRIQPTFEEGSGVVVSRGDVRYVVTEYGVADLWGKNIRERAMALIGIAHPDFRSELMGTAKARRYILPDQVVPRATYPWSQEKRDKLPDGTEVIVRPARLTDERALQDMFYKLSDESVYRRFMAFKKVHSHKDMQNLVDQDFEANMALVILEAQTEEPLGVVRYDVDPATGLGDLAFVVRDGWQGRGIGTIQMRHIIEAGRARGLPGFQLDILSQNRGMLALINASGLQLRSHLEDGVYHFEALFAEGKARSDFPHPGASLTQPR